MQRWGQENGEIDNEPKLRMPKDEVIRKVRDKIQSIDDLMAKTYHSMEFGMWHRETENLLRHAFGPKSQQVEGFSQICYTPRVVIRRNSYSHPSYLNGLQTARECLLAIVKEVEEFYNDEPQYAEVSVNMGTMRQIGVGNDGIVSRKVFVVHGHDEGMKNSIARFLENLDLTPIILHKQPNGGKTIIEKFEKNADVAFAVVLMSPDDEGREKVKNKEGKKLKDRARQNVILELGYFIGRLGRSRVCALLSGEVEIPSDIFGVLYVPYDSNGGWKTQLINELREAGIPIDDTEVAKAIMS